MDRDEHNELLGQATELTDEIVRGLVTAPEDLSPALSCIGRLSGLQGLYGREFPVLSDEVEFWEAVWLRTDRLRRQWDRIESATARVGQAPIDRLQGLLDLERKALYDWTRLFIREHAPNVPTAAHFELGIDALRPDRRGLHERIEGLYESAKRIGRLPEVREGVEVPPGRVNFAIIYGGGWNVSTFSVLREAEHFPGLNAFVAFDHPGAGLYGREAGRSVRLATAGLFRTSDADDYVLATFRRPPVLHFACPHEWTGQPPHELGLPVLRSGLTLEIVGGKLNVTRALEWYARSAGVELPLIPEEGVPPAEIPVDLDRLEETAHAALGRLERRGVREAVVKPARGEQARDVEFFELPAGRDAAVRHAARLALESGAVIQERVRPRGDEDFNWRVLVAGGPSGEPKVVGRFARKGHGSDVEMVPDRQMLTQCGMSGPEGEALLALFDEVSCRAFRAVAGYAEELHPDFPWRPLGAGTTYAVPYLLGIDLIGEARIMEVNGNEVAGMWTDDRLYPETRGRSSRTVLESAEAAGSAYKAALSGRP